MKTTEPTFINLKLSGNCSPLLFTSLACFCLQLSNTILWFRDCFSYAKGGGKASGHNYWSADSILFCVKTHNSAAQRGKHRLFHDAEPFLLALFLHLKMTICNESNVLYMLESAIREREERWRKQKRQFSTGSAFSSLATLFILEQGLWEEAEKEKKT